MDYGRGKPLRPRPWGTGAFHDFALAAGRRRALQPPSTEAEQALDRWYSEGGNTQTSIARRGG